MKVSDLILQRLADEGVRLITHVYGAACGELMDAVTRQDRLRHVCFLHEQAAGFAAEGISKAGGFGVSIVTSGPGGQNLVTPIAGCFYDSTPALFITGQANTKFLRPTTALRQVAFQETDIIGTVNCITKYAKQIRDPKRIRYELDKAIWFAKEGRPGPVLLDIPIDIQKAEIGDPATLEGFAPPPRTWDSPAIQDAIGAFLKDLAVSRRPVLLIGGGCQNYKEEFHALSERLQIPCFATWNALDIVTSDSAYYAGRVGTYGGAGRNFGVQNSDLLLAIGCRISGRITGGMPETFARAAKRYYVDIDTALLEPKWQPLKAHVNIHCDAGHFMRRLTDRAEAAERPEWLSICRTWRERYDPVKRQHIEEWHLYGFLRHLSELMPSNAIIVNDTGGAVISASHAFETKRGQRYFTSNGSTPMGFAFSAALGAALQEPRRPVFCLSGDGGFQMNIQELQTMKRMGIPVRTFILNNLCYANTMLYQHQNYDGRYIACTAPDYVPPDFVKVSQAYGVKAYTIDKKWEAGNHSYQRDTMDEWLPRIMATDGPWICDVRHPYFMDYQPRMLLWNAGVEEMFPPLYPDEFRSNMLIDPVPGWEDRQKLYKPIR